MQLLAATFLALAALATLLAGRPAAGLETAAREAILVDFETGSVLLAKNADERMPPASMSKIMTSYVVFTRLREGRISLEDKLPVSETAWRKGGSKMFVEVGNEVKVEDLLRGVIVQSGNDACIVLAEGLSGSEAAFAAEMTRIGKEIGLTGSIFTNSTGWPDENHRMTARDLATLARRVIADFPEYYHYYSEKEFTWNGIRQGNRNPVLYRNIGADGLKTGHTEEAGYGLTASAERDGRRLILVINGLSSQKARSEESLRLLEWGFREFSNYALFKSNEVVEQAPVWLGATESVPLVTADEIKVTMPMHQRDQLVVKVAYPEAIPAPISAGQKVAELIVERPDAETQVHPLYAGQAVDRIGPMGRIWQSVKHLVLGLL